MADDRPDTGGMESSFNIGADYMRELAEIFKMVDWQFAYINGSKTPPEERAAEMENFITMLKLLHLKVKHFCGIEKEKLEGAFITALQRDEKLKRKCMEDANTESNITGKREFSREEYYKLLQNTTGIRADIFLQFYDVLHEVCAKNNLILPIKTDDKEKGEELVNIIER